MIPGYPRSMSEISTWANASGVTLTEARHRFAQFAALCGIVSIPDLQQSLVLKGGNAIDFVWFPNRSTRDLDFSFDHFANSPAAVAILIREQLIRALRISTSRFGVAYAVNSVKQHPPGEGKTFITYEARIGYGLPDERQLLIRMQNNQPSPHMLPIEVSINEIVCDSALFTIHDGFPKLRISTVEEIVSEKLRALLQQTIRNRNRKQDILDIAVLVGATPNLDLQKVASFLQTKSAARNVPVSKSAFNDPEVSERARLDYDELIDSTRTSFIPFDEALAIVLNLVNDLAIPESHPPNT